MTLIIPCGWLCTIQAQDAEHLWTLADAEQGARGTICSIHSVLVLLEEDKTRPLVAYI